MFLLARGSRKAWATSASPWVSHLIEQPHHAAARRKRDLLSGALLLLLLLLIIIAVLLSLLVRNDEIFVGRETRRAQPSEDFVRCSPASIQTIPRGPLHSAPATHPRRLLWVIVLWKNLMKSVHLHHAVVVTPMLDRPSVLSKQ